MFGNSWGYLDLERYSYSLAGWYDEPCSCRYRVFVGLHIVHKAGRSHRTEQVSLEVMLEENPTSISAEKRIVLLAQFSYTIVQNFL